MSGETINSDKDQAARYSSVIDDKKLRGFFFRLRLRTQLLIVTNIVVVIILSGFAFLEYRAGVEAQLKTKVLSLNDEAKTLLVAISGLIQYGESEVQDHIDRVCSVMNDIDSPAHTIEVRIGNVMLNSRHAELHANHPTDPLELVTGVAWKNDLRVRITESRAPVIKKARQAELDQVVGIVVAGLFGAAVFNILVLRLATRPMGRLVDVVRRIGQGEVGATTDIHSNAEITELGRAVSYMSQELAKRNLEQHLQLERAARLQRHLIQIASDQAHESVSIEYHPADDIGGDLVDVINCDNGDMLICLADVVGHGIHAAMAATMLKTLLRSLYISNQSPAILLRKLNERFIETSLPEDFATMVLVRVNRSGSMLVHASAGHETCFIKHTDGSLSMLKSTGLVLGVIADTEYSETEQELQPGDIIVLVSDGVTEARNSEGSFFGRQGIAQTLKYLPNLDLHEFGSAIYLEVERHRNGSRQLDDITVVVISANSALGDSAKDASVQ